MTLFSQNPKPPRIQFSNREKPCVHYDSDAKCSKMDLTDRAVARKKQLVL